MHPAATCFVKDHVYSSLCTVFTHINFCLISIIIKLTNEYDRIVFYLGIIVIGLFKSTTLPALVGIVN